MLLIAQATLAGAEGWVGTGLLGTVLGWLLLVHLPAKDKQLKELLEAQAEERKAKELADVAAAEKYKAALDLIVQHCKEDSERIIHAFKEEIGRARK